MRWRASARTPRIRRVLPPAVNAISRPVSSSARGELQQTHAWTVSISRSTHSRLPVLSSDHLFVAQNVVTYDVLCIRACRDDPCAPRLYPDVYDVVGCARKMAGGQCVRALE